MSKEYERALKFAYENLSKDVYAHSIGVASYFEDALFRSAAVLHDIVEDSLVTLDSLREAGFSDLIITAVDHLTRRSGEVYMDYIKRVAQNDIARVIKLADLDYNLRRRKQPPNESLKKRYLKAEEFLLSIL